MPTSRDVAIFVLMTMTTITTMTRPILLPLVHVRWVINGQVVSVKHTGGMEWSM